MERHIYSFNNDDPIKTSSATIDPNACASSSHVTALEGLRGAMVKFARSARRDIGQIFGVTTTARACIFTEPVILSALPQKETPYIRDHVLPILAEDRHLVGLQQDRPARPREGPGQAECSPTCVWRHL
jgi:hypothetical protein